jgi:hypothetical protein
MTSALPAPPSTGLAADSTETELVRLRDGSQVTLSPTISTSAASARS